MSDISPITTQNGFSIKQLEQMPGEQILTQDAYKNIRLLAHELICAGEPGEAAQFLDILKTKANTIQRTRENEKYLSIYTDIVYGLRFLYISGLDDEEIEKLFQFHLVSSIRLGVDVRYYLSVLFSAIGTEDGIVAMQKFLTEAIHNNTEKIGSGDGSELKSWILDYDAVYEGIKGPLQEVEYLGKSDKVKMIGQKEREILQKVLQVYDFLRYPGEQEIPRMWDMPPLPPTLVQSSTIEPNVSPASAKGMVQSTRLNQQEEVTSQDDYVAKYNTLPIPMESIQAKVKDIIGRLESHPHLTSQILQNPENVRDKAYVVGALLLAVRDGSIPPDLKSYIRNILETKLGWSEEDSAKIGIRIGNMLGEPYRGWAYYNKEKGRFEWSL